MSLINRLRRAGWPGPSGLRALEDRRLFAIGDIHGCDDLLASLLDGISAETVSDSRPPLLIFLGDYIDRGPDSRAVLERLSRLPKVGVQARFLCGNHEEVMLQFLERPWIAADWLDFGGRATLLSYDVSPPDVLADAQGWETARQQLLAALPDQHQRFLRGLEDQIALGDCLFVHAGVDPRRALNQQRPHDLRWIREPFLSNTRMLAKTIVHGHTPTLKPHADRRRIGVDTWAYHTGVLTAADLSAGRVRFLQARRKDGAIQVGWSDEAGISQEFHHSRWILPQS